MNLLSNVGKLGVFAVVGLLGAAIVAPAFAQDVTDEAIGRWLRPNQGWIVEFHPCGDYLCGEIVEGEGTDAESGESVVGIQMLFDLEKHGDNEWRGRMYNPEDGHEYMGKVTILDENHVRMSGCMLFGTLCRSEEWPREGSE
jgi:uncharacterized protein (DUF2147 family)